MSEKFYLFTNKTMNKKEQEEYDKMADARSKHLAKSKEQWMKENLRKERRNHIWQEIKGTPKHVWSFVLILLLIVLVLLGVA